MNDTLERLQISMAANSIVHYGQAPYSCNYFQRSIEGISPQPNPPHNSQRNMENQHQHTQQDITAVNDSNNFVILDK